MHAPSPEPADPEALSLHAADRNATDAIGRALAPVLAPGDIVTLAGPLGAGKSHLARALIRARLGDRSAEVPSPTYTLVNIYATPMAEIWHADLYRVGPEEVAEISLSDALDHAILMIEWPDRWPDLPERRLEVALAMAGAGRDVTITARGAGWERALAALRGAT